MSALDKINTEEILEAIGDAHYTEDFQLTIKTNKGDIKLNMFATKTPHTVANFEALAKAGYMTHQEFFLWPIVDQAPMGRSSLSHTHRHRG